MSNLIPASRRLSTGPLRSLTTNLCLITGPYPSPQRATTVDEFRVPTDLGVTHVLLNGSLECRCCFRLLVESGLLPSPGRVRDDMG